MKILQFHNKYAHPGGEDAVALSEKAMLCDFGHEVFEYHRSNSELSSLGLWAKGCFYLNDVYFSRLVYKNVRALINKVRPDVAHFHNSFLMIGPAAYEACFDEGVPVVQTLHNYRFLCAAGTFFRDGRICEECLLSGRKAGVFHGCWHGIVGSWLMARVINTYERRGILKRIARFIALSEFSCNQFIAAGWGAKRIVVKPNFLDKDPGIGNGKRKHVLYVGALQPYKGVRTLLNAWASCLWPVPLKIVGSGPLDKELSVLNVPGVEWLGQRDQAEVILLMKEALCVVVPSECYENFPRVVIEAYACGTPVVASRLGVMTELVEDHRSGVLFSPGDVSGLVSVLSRLVSDPISAERMGQDARLVFEKCYGLEAAYANMMHVYKEL